MIKRPLIKRKNPVNGVGCNGKSSRRRWWPRPNACGLISSRPSPAAPRANGGDYMSVCGWNIIAPQSRSHGVAWASIGLYPKWRSCHGSGRPHACHDGWYPYYDKSISIRKRSILSVV